VAQERERVEERKRGERGRRERGESLSLTIYVPLRIVGGKMTKIHRSRTTVD
jgi:hypothetical protein